LVDPAHNSNASASAAATDDPDAPTPVAATLADEEKRLASLLELDILDTEPEQVFDDLAETASLISGTPIAFISFIDSDRQWLKAKKGTDLVDTPRATSLCDHTIRKLDGPLVIEDTAADPSYADSPLVTGYPKLGFYAGAPILTAAGYAVGTVAVAAHEPRNFSDEQVVALELIAKQVSAVLELRRDSGTLTAGLVKERARAAENAVWRQTHDSLTSLPTRSVLEERIARLDEEELATDNPKAVSVLAIDLVGFGEVNLAITRDGGDRALCQIAYLIAGCLPAHALLARIDDTVFAALVEDVEAKEASEIAARIHRLFVNPIDVPNFDPVLVPAVIGAATSGPRRGFAPSEVLVAGEAGVAEAKRQGAGSTIIARWESFARRERIANLRTKLRSAIESEEIEVAYMPLVRLSDGAVIGTEALARWTDAEYGQIPPSEFVAISETNGFVSHLDAYVLERALAAFADGRVEGDELSVNISPRGVGPGFTHAVTTALTKAGVAPTSLVIEVTERAGLTGNPILIASLVALASTGVRIALDDFGAGETAIGHLRTMPIDRLKIDKGLIKDLANDKSGSARAVVDSIAMMADSLGIETLAEGIEEEKQRTEAQGAGVKIGQGFLFGQPLAAVPAGKA